MFKKSRITTAALLALGGAVLVTGAHAQQAASSDQRVEVTGSRLKRAQTEGALPVTVIDRAAIEASGQVSVAELMRDTTFASFGNTKPQSGSSAQALSDIDLRGLGSNRTLVLVDGRRLAKAPFSGQAQDLNAIPLAAIERIEILSDGASAVYGSDAIGGVVNIITRKNFNGLQFTYGEGKPDQVGGDTQEYSVLWGASSAKGRVFAGLSGSERGMIYTKDQPGGDVLGVSSFGNNYRRLNSAGNGTGAFAPVPGFDCTTNNFWVNGSTCSFNFNAIAANEAAVGNKGLFGNGEFNISDDWSVYASGSISRVDSFGRYAPTPVQATLASTSPAYAAITAAVPGLAAASPNGLQIRHRMAAAGARDSNSDATVSSGMMGFKGQLFKKVDLDFGARAENYKYIELGRNYIVRPLLEQALNNGSYDIFKPFANSADVLNSVKSTISRDSIWDTKELYGTASTELFKIGGRPATGLVGFESRKEKYQDMYDPQQEAGIIEGSAGNSSGAGRQVQSAFFELALPVQKNLELSLAGRYDSYKDTGTAFNDHAFSPKVSMKWRPTSNLTLRGSAGKGFRAPTLDVLTQKDSFSADFIEDLRTCRAYGVSAARCGDANGDDIKDSGQQVSIQANATVVANPNLKAETSNQMSLGIVFDATKWLTLSLDAYKIRINDRIYSPSGQTVINREAEGRPVPLSSVIRDPATGLIEEIIRSTVNDTTVDTTGLDLNARTDFALGAWGRLRSDFLVSYILDYSLDGGRNLVGDQGAPRYRVNFGNTWSYGKFRTTLSVLHIAKQPGYQPEGANENEAQPSTKGWTTLNLGVSYLHPTGTRLTVGVLNIENKKPELIGYDGRPWNFGLYDSLGRQVYLRLQQTF